MIAPYELRWHFLWQHLSHQTHSQLIHHSFELALSSAGSSGLSANVRVMPASSLICNAILGLLKREYGSIIYNRRKNDVTDSPLEEDMVCNRTRVAAVTASLVFALSGGVAFADEAANVQQGTPQASAQEQVVTGEQSAQGQATTGGESAGAQGTTGSEAAGQQDATVQTAEGGQAVAETAVAQSKDGTEAGQTSSETKSDESKTSDTGTVDGQKVNEAGSQETAGATDAKGATSSTEATTTTDDVALEAQVAELNKSTYNQNTRSYDNTSIDESSIEWVPVDVSKYSSDKYRYVDEDGYRVYYYINDAWKLEGSEEAVKNEWVAARVKIGEDGEFLAPATSPSSRGAHWRLTTDHTSGELYSSRLFGGYCAVSAYMDADVPKDIFTKTLVDKNGETIYYYPGGEYGPAGYYYQVTSERLRTHIMDARYAGMYWHFDTEGGSPFSGTSTVNEEKAAPTVSASFDAYESGTATVTPATGTDYVSATAAEATPATSDATSIAGAVAAAVSALGALGLGKAIRRK